MRSLFRAFRALLWAKEPPRTAYLLELLPVHAVLWSDPALKIPLVRQHPFFAAGDADALTLARRLVPPLEVRDGATPYVGYLLLRDGSRSIALLYALCVEWWVTGDLEPRRTWKHALHTTWDDALAWFASEPMRDGKTLIGPQGIIKTERVPQVAAPRDAVCSLETF